MVKDYTLTACGLSCDLCDANTTKIQDSAKYLVNVFEDPMFLEILSMTNPEFKPENFPAFKEVLEVLKKFPPCPGCEGRKDCAIKQCTQKKGIENCSICAHLNIEEGICSALPEPSGIPFLPPAPIFFNGLSKRYQKWNIKNLDLIKQGKKAEVNKRIGNMIKKGKTSRDIIDTSINLFDQIKSK
ncbi:MAG: DUF3795 domain-containing protein [Promethearchaeota archaeon]